MKAVGTPQMSGKQLTHNDKIAFYNALSSLSNRSREIFKRLFEFKYELYSRECKEITQEQIDKIVSTLPDFDISKEIEEVIKFRTRNIQ